MPARKVVGEACAEPARASARRRRPNGNDPQVVRALALLIEMARSRRGVLLKPFAEKRGYTLRGVYRARDALISVGAPIRPNADSAGRWQLLDGWMPPSVVGPAKDELMALFVARQLAPGLRGTTVARSLDSLWSKLTSSNAQQHLQLAAPALLFSVRGLAAIDYSEHRVTIDRLQDAIVGKHALRIQYRTPDATITDRVIEPAFLHWDGGLEAMYVPSWCRLREAVRVFAVHRIMATEPMPDDVAVSVPPRRIIDRAFRLWYRDNVEHVEVAFSARVAGEIRERQWHSTQRLVDRPDGGVHLHLDISSPEELERWLLGFGPDAVVVAPTRLADQVRRSHAVAAGAGDVVELLPIRRKQTLSASKSATRHDRRKP